MAIIDKPDMKIKNDNSHSLVSDKHIAIKSASKLFGVSKKYSKRETRK